MITSLRHTSLIGLIAIVFMALTALITPRSALATNISAEAADHIQTLGDELLAKLERRKGDPNLKQELGKVLEQEIALRNIARFALGRYWRLASASERAEYLDLFSQMVTRVYVSRFEDYSGQTFELTGHRMGTARDALVSTRVAQPNGPSVDVDWRIRKIDGRLQIIDIIVGGVSMAVTQRSEFSSIIQRNRGRVSALNDSLRRQLATDGAADERAQAFDKDAE